MIDYEKLLEEKEVKLNGKKVLVRVPKKLSPKVREEVKKDLENLMRKIVKRKFGS